MLQILLISISLMSITFLSHKFFGDAIDKFLFTEDPRTLADYSFFSLYIFAIVVGVILFLSLIKSAAKGLNTKMKEALEEDY